MQLATQFRQLLDRKPDLPILVKDWPGDWKEIFEERAAIMEYDGNRPRPEAERRAERCVREAVRRL